MSETALPLCVRIEAKDEGSCQALQKDGWREIETLVLMERATAPMEYPTENVLLLSDLSDYWTDFTVKIARENMGPNRFIRDKLLDEEFAKDVREKWIREAPDNVSVYFHEDRVTGFLVQEENRLALLTVNQKHRGKGMGKMLTKAFIHRAWARGFSSVRLGTQETNTPALTLYRGLEFDVVGRQRTFHK